MTNEETILKKAIEKAADNGCILFSKFTQREKEEYNKVKIESEEELFISYWYSKKIWFDHEFAKAFWGKSTGRRILRMGDAYYPFYRNGWRLHLQQMVLEENPIKYLERFL